jgi:hypothetical protein
MSFGDDNTKETYPLMKRDEPGFLAWTYMYISALFTWPFTIAHFNKRPSDINCMKKHNIHVTAETRAVSSKEISINKLKAVCKSEDYGVTLNDMCMGMISSVLHEYFEKHGDKSKNFTMMIPAAFKGVPLDPKDYYYENSFIAVTVYMDLIRDLHQAAIHAKESAAKQLKDSPYVSYLLVKAYCLLLPQNTLDGVVKELGGKGSVIFSNVPGFQREVKIMGGKYKSFYYVGSGIGSADNFFSLFTCDGRASITFTANTGNVPDIEEFQRMLDDRIDKLGIADD